MNMCGKSEHQDDCCLDRAPLELTRNNSEISYYYNNLTLDTPLNK